MQIELSLNPLGNMVWAKRLLQEGEVGFHFSKNPQKNPFEPFWEEMALEWILKEKNCPEKIGILYHHQNFALEEKLKKLQKKTNPISPKDSKKESPPTTINLIPFPILSQMAEEGWGESVEFRRIARLVLRNAKNQGTQWVFFPEMIFGEANTHQTLQSIAGRSLKVFTAFNIPILPFEIEILKSFSPGPLTFEFELTHFEQKRIEQFLKRKLPKTIKKNKIPSV